MKEAVLEAVLKLVLERGVAGFSIAELAKAAGVHETTIYRRWGDIEHAVLETLLERIELEIPRLDTGSFRTDMIASMRNAIEFFATPMGKVLIRALGSAGGEANELKRSYWKKRLEGLEPMLERARARGELVSVQDGVRLFQAMIGPIYLRLFVTGEPLGPELAESVVDAVLGS